ncbi:MAG: xanthine dehydrogenase family protein molybdopterin-binding subunit [Saprospiraceae bacterium]|nr:xanthine dehydrogenase family protein molybdopterin-binding subunit [Saprospiraceae bacterium]
MKKNNDQTAGITRRQFVVSAGGLGFFITAGAITPGFLKRRIQTTAESPLEEVTAWVQIGKNGMITIFNPAAEMGQGSMTALAAIIAEELDVDWNMVCIENALVIPAIYGLHWGGKLGGPMMTVGSRTIKGYYNGLRLAGAQARKVLLQNVAEKWQVPIGDLITEPSTVLHKISGRKIGYGEIVSFAKIPNPLPAVTEQDLKDPATFRLVGHVMPRFDIPAKVNGSASYSIDTQVEGMVYASMSRSPINGTKPQLLNEKEVRESDGLIDIVSLDHGIAVVAKTYGQALKAKKSMQIKWSEGAKAEGYDSTKSFGQYQAMVTANSSDKIKVVLESGDAAKVIKSASKVYSGDYFTDYLCHAQMEPLNLVVSVAGDGQSAEAWVGTQMPDGDRNSIAKVLNIDESKVKFNTCYLGGGFGRRSGFSSEAAIIAKQVKLPVKLIWSREDDIQYGAFRPISLQRLKAGVDNKGNITGWQHDVAGPDERLQTGGVKMDYYSIPDQSVRLHLADHGVRTAFWRSVGHGPNKFAQEAFIGEIAYDQKIDTYAYRRRLMKDSPRHLAILDKVATMSKWGAPISKGRAKGLAFSDYGGSYTAGVVEIALDPDSGQIRVHHVWAAVDAGVIVQPNNAIAQMEGGIVMGISSTLFESITFKNGKVQQSNFHDYPILRMADAPESIEIALIPSSLPPTSLGEVSLPLMGGAIANAFLTLTGKPLRHLPFTNDKVLEVLAG